MKKKILSIFLSLALIFSAVPFTSIIAFATGGECSTYGHSYVEIYRLEATCETDGYIEYICQVCSGDSYQEPIPATGHSYAHLYTQDATCSQDGWSEYACMNCGNSYTDDFIPAYGCEMFASPQTPVGPFCDSYGFVEYKCDLCGTVVFTEELPPAGHSFGEWETIQYVTCAQEGINRRTCEVCGETEEEIIPKKLDHAFDEQEYVPPTCTSDGYLIMKCSICGFADTIEEYEATGHTDLNNNGLCDVCEEPNFVPVSGKCGDNLTWTFNEFDGTLTIYGTGAMYDFNSDEQPWDDYVNDIKIIVIEKGVTTIGNYAFYSYDSVISITIADSVTSIGSKALISCESLTNITVDINNKNYSSDEYGVLFNKDKTTLIQYPAGNTRTSYTIPNSVTTIGDTAFSYGRSLTNVTIPDSVIKIGKDAFRYCTGLTDVTLPNSVTTIGNSAFYWCTSLTNVTISNNLTLIPVSSFYWCTSLTSITIPDSVTRINSYAFMYCSNLTSIIIPDSISVINSEVFNKCSKLKDVYYYGTEAQWSKISIGRNNEPLLNATIHYNYVDPNKFTGIKDDCFYKNDVKQKAYQLVEFDGDFYYVGDCNKIVKSKRLYVTTERANGLTFADGTPIPAGWYEFDENGKMILFSGIVDDYAYVSGVKIMAYQLVEIDGDFYYVGDCNKIVKSKRLYVTTERANGLTFANGTPIPAGWYEFDENGKMILFSGIVDDYAYVSGVKMMAYQLVEINGNFYYVGDCNKIVKSKRLYVTTERANGLTFADGTPIPAGWYEFDADGKMILFSGIVDDYAYVSGVKMMAYQLVEIDGNFYYVGDCNKIVKDKRVYLTTERINDLTFADGTVIEAGWYNFDADGKMIIE